MLEWISEHSDALNVVLSAAMLLVWLGYFEVFLRGYRRERRPKILISRGSGSSLHAHCLLSNMSAETIYIHSLIAKLNNSDEETFAAVTDLVGDSEDESRISLKEATLQGPVAAGDFLDAGTFASILRRAGWSAPATGADSGDHRSIEIELTVLATYRSEDLIVGASRRFAVEAAEGGWRVAPRTVATQQIRNKRQRRALLEAYTDYLN